MEPVQYLDAIRTNATALVDAADAAGLDAAVPPCPEWTVADLLGHIGRVHRWAAGNLDRAPDEGFWPGNEIEIPEAPQRPEWVREGAVALAAALDRPADTPAWTWIPPSTIGFWQRRQAHETAMHRVDAQFASGAVEAIDAELAADGIDEFLEIVGKHPWRAPPTGDGETLHFHCTDVEGNGSCASSRRGSRSSAAHEKADVAARGTASDLLCWLQGRGPVERLEVFGDATLLARWREAATF